MLRVAQEGAPGAGTTAPCPREQRIPRGPNTGGQTPGAAAPRPSWTIVSGRTAPPFSPSERLAGTARPGGESGLRGRCGRPRVTKLQPPRARSLPRLPRPTRI